MIGGPATKKLDMNSHRTEVAYTRFLFNFLMPQTQI